ncbi:unnamed protein product [Vicia faba]|uniref:Uncharacterized protein n=1 Tax=Vicia faba TaxID=3906 RepID=A0AAV0ZPX7_VICFA|nr:unnamed protein product [Vicia faba]
MQIFPHLHDLLHSPFLDSSLFIHYHTHSIILHLHNCHAIFRNQALTFNLHHHQLILHNHFSTFIIFNHKHMLHQPSTSNIHLITTITTSSPQFLHNKVSLHQLHKINNRNHRKK